MPIEYRYVDGELPDLTTKLWTTHNGVAPYLNDSSLNSISTFTTDQVDKIFTFEDTAILWANITKVELELEINSASEFVGVHAALSLDGTTFTEKGNCGFDGSYTWGWNSNIIDITSFFASQADINNCRMRATSHRSGATAIIGVRRARLKITYTSGSVLRRSLVGVGL